MFKDPVTSSPLVGGQAETVLSRIYGDGYMSDVSFVSTLRALLGRRLPEDRALHFECKSTYFARRKSSGDSNLDVANKILEDIPCGCNDTLHLHYFTDTEVADRVHYVNAVAEHFESICHGYKRNPMIHAFFAGATKKSKQPMMVECFVNPDINSAILFIDSMSMERYHLLQCATGKILNWWFRECHDEELGHYYEPWDGGLEMSLIQLLANKNATVDAYVDAVRKIADTYDFRSALIRQKLNGFEVSYLRDAVERERERYNNLNGELGRIQQNFNSKLRERNNCSLQIAGMESKIAEGGDSEIMEFFLHHKNLVLCDAYGSEVVFIVKTQLGWFDPDMAEAAINNRNSCLYTSCERVSRDNEKLKKLWRAIFLDEKLRINFCAKFRLSVNGGVNADSTYGAFDMNEFGEFSPNPHLDYYSCLGDHAREINNRMSGGDYIGAIEQCVASCQSLAFGDSTVMSKFCEIMSGRTGNNRCIVLPDGRVVRPKEAIEWLDANE